MKTTVHKADSRGHADHGWLNTYHTFSFASYYDPDRIHFGALRVLNDDTVKGGRGFGRHPHKDMEIISIPLEGELTHGDSMGNSGTIKSGQVQVMSAGTGVIHSEKNGRSDEDVKFLQIWVIPNVMGVDPRYDELNIADDAQVNHFQQIVSPSRDDEGLWIHQDAWFFYASFNQNIEKTYRLQKEGNGVYIFVIEGSIDIADRVLSSRDGIGIEDVGSFHIKAAENTRILLMEVPMLDL